MLKTRIEDLVKESIEKGIQNSEPGSLESVPGEVPVEYPKNPEHGDRAISIAMKLSRDAKIAPRAIAEAIVKNLDQSLFTGVDIAGPGFINLKLDWTLIEEGIAEVHRLDKGYGRLSEEQRPDTSYQKVLVEYVSANPTGDLHIGHGRQAIYGSALVTLLKWAGYDVDAEFYINDAGAQIAKLGDSVRAAILIQEGKLDQSNYPEEAYPLDSMLEFIKPELYKVKLEGRDLEEIAVNDYAEIGRVIFLDAQRDLLAGVGVEFDKWFSENENLYAGQGAKPEQPNETEVAKVCEQLGQHSYEEDGALWFKSEDLGDERNRVLRKSDGYYTYLAADFAYHLNKLQRGYEKLINIWGADHHGQEPSLQGGLKVVSEASGIDFTDTTLEIPLMQMVSLSRAGEEVKMSKRTGDIVTVRELAEEVGVDALRYFLVEQQINNRMVFDLELATKQDKDNPVYYIQYAHARCCSILRTLTAEQLDQDTLGDAKLDKAVLEPAQLKGWLKQFTQKQNTYNVAFTELEAEALSSTKNLALAVLSFPEEIAAAALARAPHKIANYLRELATLFHQFYAHNRVIVDDEELMKARVSLVVATQKVLRNGLDLLGISAPEKM